MHILSALILTLAASVASAHEVNGLVRPLPLTDEAAARDARAKRRLAAEERQRAADGLLFSTEHPEHPRLLRLMMLFPQRGDRDLIEYATKYYDLISTEMAAHYVLELIELEREVAAELQKDFKTVHAELELLIRLARATFKKDDRDAITRVLSGVSPRFGFLFSTTLIARIAELPVPRALVNESRPRVADEFFLNLTTHLRRGLTHARRAVKKLPRSHVARRWFDATTPVVAPRIVVGPATLVNASSILTEAEGPAPRGGTEFCDTLLSLPEDRLTFSFADPSLRKR